MWQQRLIVLIVGMVAAIAAHPAQAQEKTSLNLPVSEIVQPLISAEGLLVQQPAPTPQAAQVTGVQLKPTEKGLEVILETTAEFTEVLNSETENSLITDIPNAQLRLPKGGVFQQDNPTQTITSVEVTNLDAKTLRVTVTGKAGVPTAEVSQSPQALILSVVAPPAPAPQPTPPVTPVPALPAEPRQPAAPEAPRPVPQAEEEPLELTVTAEEEVGGYSVPDATTATKTDTPLRDIPASIQVVPRQVIEDQRAVRIEETLRNVSGVNVSNTSGGQGTDFSARGFSLNQFKNGFFDNKRLSPTNLANIERIEVLKGPASVLYGRAEPGGIINIVTKKPLFEPYYAADFTIGSYDFYQPTLDISGPLNSSKTVAYRLNLAYENAGSFRDFKQTEGLLVAPSLTWNIGPNTALTFEGTYYDTSYPIDRGLAAIGDEVADLPISRYLGDPSFRNSVDEKQAYLYLDHQFNPSLSLRSAFSVRTVKEIYNSLERDELLPDNRTLALAANYGVQNEEAYTFQNDLIGKFKTGPISHTVLLGLELDKETQAFSNNRTASNLSMDIFNPVYNFSPIYEDQSSFDGFTEAFAIGVYLQDQIELLDNLKLLIGGRFDSYDYEDRYNDPSLNTISEASKFTPRVGVVYQPIEPISLYGSFSQSFSPQFGRNRSGTPFKPEQGTQYEVGIKGDWLDGRLSSTLAAYQITKSNVLTENPDDDRFSIQVGEQRSRGIELDVAGEILPGWNIIASYAYTDAKITEDNTFEVGNRFNGVPYNTASLWTTYEIQSGLLAGLGFGAGIFFVDSRAGDLENSFEVPSYARTDAAVYYTRGNVKVGLNFKNLFNVRYFESTVAREYINPGAPFSVLGTVSVQF